MTKERPHWSKNPTGKCKWHPDWIPCYFRDEDDGGACHASHICTARTGLEPDYVNELPLMFDFTMEPADAENLIHCIRHRISAFHEEIMKLMCGEMKPAPWMTVDENIGSIRSFIKDLEELPGKMLNEKVDLENGYAIRFRFTLSHDDAINLSECIQEMITHLIKRAMKFATGALEPLVGMTKEQEISAFERDIDYHEFLRKTLQAGVVEEIQK